MCVRRPPWRGAAAGPSVQVPAARLRLPCQFWSPVFFYLLLLASVSLSLFDLKVACVVH